MGSKYEANIDSERLDERHVLGEWHETTNHHACGDRTTVRRRVVVQPSEAGRGTIALEEKRELDLGPPARADKREHDWRLVASIDIRPDELFLTDHQRQRERAR